MKKLCTKEGEGKYRIVFVREESGILRNRTLQLLKKMELYTYKCG